jgi:hypothetical protein
MTHVIGRLIYCILTLSPKPALFAPEGIQPSSQPFLGYVVTFVQIYKAVCLARVP